MACDPAYYMALARAKRRCPGAQALRVPGARLIHTEHNHDTYGELDVRTATSHTQRSR